jgi:hypothetical protein
MEKLTLYYYYDGKVRLTTPSILVARVRAKALGSDIYTEECVINAKA